MDSSWQYLVEGANWRHRKSGYVVEVVNFMGVVVTFWRLNVRGTKPGPRCRLQLYDFLSTFDPCVPIPLSREADLVDKIA